MSGAIPPLPQYAFMVWCSVKGQGQVYLYLYNTEVMNVCCFLSTYAYIFILKEKFIFTFLSSYIIYNVLFLQVYGAAS
jgi:hypothetical protein